MSSDQNTVLGQSSGVHGHFRTRGRKHSPILWLGVQANGKPLTPEQATVVVIAWRTLYAADVHARLNDKSMNLGNAFSQMTRLVLSRVKAHGAKWRAWYLNQRLWQQGKAKSFHGNIGTTTL